MPVVSGSSTLPTTTWSAPYSYDGPGRHPLGQYLLNGLAYDQIYERQLWVNVAVNKLVGLQVQLPRKVYRRADRGREDARDTPFGRLIARPSKRMDPVRFYSWFFGMRHIHGCSFARKVRDRGGRPIEMVLIHPTRMRYGPEEGGAVPSPIGGVPSSGNRWWYRRDDGTEVSIPRRDLVVWSSFNPTDPNGGLSPLEPLRDTLENEAGARTANSALWRNGGKPMFVLRHPGKFNNPAVTKNLSNQFQERHGGVEQWGKPLVLQEGMEAFPLPLDTELQYIDTRKLNREEVAAEYDIPPPAVHILDRATFSNITEQFRSLFRQTMPPHLDAFEAVIDFDLRDGRFGESGEPDFGDEYYFEHLVDGVMRGSYEARIDAHAKAIQTGQVTPAEVREMENRPFIEDSDTLLINAAVVPIAEASRTVADGVDTPLPDDGTLSGGPAGLLNATSDDRDVVVRQLMGRLSRQGSVDEIDLRHLTEGLGDDTRAVVLAAVARIREDGGSMAELRNMLKLLLGDDQ